MTRIALLLLTCLAFGSLPPAARARLSWQAAVQKVDAVIEPADARPGQTVTYKLIVKLNPGYHTYPTVQPDPKVTSHNTIKLPDAGDLIFVEEVKDPEG